MKGKRLKIIDAKTGKEISGLKINPDRINPLKLTEEQKEEFEKGCFTVTVKPEDWLHNKTTLSEEEKELYQKLIEAYYD